MKQKLLKTSILTIGAMLLAVGCNDRLADDFASPPESLYRRCVITPTGTLRKTIVQ